MEVWTRPTLNGTSHCCVSYCCVMFLFGETLTKWQHILHGNRAALEGQCIRSDVKEEFAWQQTGNLMTQICHPWCIDGLRGSTRLVSLRRTWPQPLSSGLFKREGGWVEQESGRACCCSCATAHCSPDLWWTNTLHKKEVSKPSDVQAGNAGQ